MQTVIYTKCGTVNSIDFQNNTPKADCHSTASSSVTSVSQVEKIKIKICSEYVTRNCDTVFLWGIYRPIGLFVGLVHCQLACTYSIYVCVYMYINVMCSSVLREFIKFQLWNFYAQHNNKNFPSLSLVFCQEKATAKTASVFQSEYLTCWYVMSLKINSVGKVKVQTEICGSDCFWNELLAGSCPMGMTLQGLRLLFPFCSFWILNFSVFWSQRYWLVMNKFVHSLLFRFCSFRKLYFVFYFNFVCKVEVCKYTKCSVYFQSASF